MRVFKLTSLSLAAALSCSAFGANIYIISSANMAIDNSAVTAMTLAGHNAFVGVAQANFDENISLTGYDAVYLQANYNWAGGNMPLLGQNQLRNFVGNGGGLITCEWSTWLMATGAFEMLGALMPFEPSLYYTFGLTDTLVKVTPDPVINQGVPDAVFTTLDSYAGTKSNPQVLRQGATNFYNTTDGGDSIGIAGWAYGAGRVISFATTNGPSQLDFTCQTLFGNCTTWVTNGTPLPATFIATTLGEEFIGDSSSVAIMGDGEVYSSFNDVDTLGCTMIVRSQLPAVPTRLHFNAYTQVGRPGLALQVAMLDFVSGVYRTVSGGVAPTQLAMRGGETPLAAARFRNGSGRVESRLTWSPVNDEDPSQDGWLHEVDLATWSYE